MDKLFKFIKNNLVVFSTFFLVAFVIVAIISYFILGANLEIIISLITFAIFMLLSIITRIINKASEQEKKRLNEMKDKMIKNSDATLDAIIERYSSGLDVRPVALDDIVQSSKYNVANSSESEIEKINKKSDENGKQYKELERELKDVVSKKKSQHNILELMFDNMGEIKDYFSISKRHAKFSFWLALFNCIVGIILLCLSVNFALTMPSIEPAIIAAIAGAISELFAATSLVVHKKSLTQLNHYYNALHENEMFLSTVNLVGNLSIEKQDDMYIEIIKNELAVRQSRIAIAKNNEAK